MDFFNEVSLLYGIVCDDDMPRLAAGQGFPPGYEYLWADGVKVKNPLRCSGSEYVDYVMTWIEEQINDDNVFPSSTSTPFPRTYAQTVKSVFTRLFRIFAIVYTQHFVKMEQLGAVAHLNTSFKHFIFFVLEFNLVDDRELEALDTLVNELRNQFRSQGAN